MKHKGFTLIELMIVVGIIGILATIAIPAFQAYIKKSKTAEVGAMVKELHDGAVLYYDTDWVQQGMTGGASLKGCIVNTSGSGGFGPGLPTSASEVGSKRFFDFSTDPRFSALGVTHAGNFYYSYWIDSVAKSPLQCGSDVTLGSEAWPDSAGWAYSFRAVYPNSLNLAESDFYVFNNTIIDGKMAKGTGLRHLTLTP